MFPCSPLFSLSFPHTSVSILGMFLLLDEWSLWFPPAHLLSSHTCSCSSNRATYTAAGYKTGSDIHSFPDCLTTHVVSSSRLYLLLDLLNHGSLNLFLNFVVFWSMFQHRLTPDFLGSTPSYLSYHTSSLLFPQSPC